MPIMEISIVPVGTKAPSVSRHVAKAVVILNKEKDITYQLMSMGTIIETDSVEKLLEIAGKMHKAVLCEDVQRIVTSIKIDDRIDKSITMQGKIDAVKKKLTEE